MPAELDVTSLKVECADNGSTSISVWCRCWTPDDVEDVIAWLKLAKAMMLRWEQIRKD